MRSFLETLKWLGYRQMSSEGQKPIYGKPFGFGLLTVSQIGNRWVCEYRFKVLDQIRLWSSEDVHDQASLMCAEACLKGHGAGTVEADFGFLTQEEILNEI